MIIHRYVFENKLFKQKISINLNNDIDATMCDNWIYTNVMPNAKRCRTTMNRQTKQRTESQRFVKLKEVQSNAQNQRFCTTFKFTPTHPSPPTTPRNMLFTM